MNVFLLSLAHWWSMKVALKILQTGRVHHEEVWYELPASHRAILTRAVLAFGGFSSRRPDRW